MIDVHTFKQLLLRCFDGDVPNRVMVALSGGVDSMCLAYLLSQYKRQYQPTLSIHAITIDHAYRAGSGEEAQRVGEIVEKWGVSHSIARLTYEKDVKTITNFEEITRNMRYQVFQQTCERLGIKSLLVGHNLNDRLETFLQRLQMNSTIYGLVGLKLKSPFPMSQTQPYSHVSVYRPLLPFDKLELKEMCKREGVEWFEDYTNSDRWLTKRNLLRYIVNEYIPHHVHSRPDLLVISKSNLIQTSRNIDETLEIFSAKVSALNDYINKYGTFVLDSKIARVSFTVPSKFWAELHPLVSGRWLYRTIQPISSAKHFYWSYAKIERHAISKIWEFITGDSDMLTMTYLNVLFHIVKNGGSLNFSISKQLPISSDLKDLYQKFVVGYTFSAWILYDRTWWMRIKHPEGRTIQVRPYSLKMRKQLDFAFPNLQEIPPGNLTIPIIVDGSTGEILALPTYGLVRDNLIVECVLKNYES